MIETAETYLRKQPKEFFLVKFGLEDQFDSIFTAILHSGTHVC